MAKVLVLYYSSSGHIEATAAGVAEGAGKQAPTVNDEIHASMGGVRDSGWGRTGPDSLKEFQDVIWIKSHSGQRTYPF